MLKKIKQILKNSCRAWVGQVIPLFCLLLLCSFNSYSATFKSVTSGNWNSASTWDLGSVPTATDIVEISGGDVVTVNISNAVCASLGIGTKDKAVATISFAMGSQLTVNGIVTFGDQGNTSRKGALDMAYGGKLICTSWL